MQLKKRYILISLAVVLMVGAVVFEFSGRKADASREDESLLPTVAVQLARADPFAAKRKPDMDTAWRCLCCAIKRGVSDHCIGFRGNFKYGRRTPWSTT
jgi:hypothetical protein